MVGEIPLKVIGPPGVIVIVASAKREESVTEVATTVTIVGVVLAPEGVLAVGTTAGAVYTPFASMEPHPVALPLTVQVASDINGLGLEADAAVVGVDCVTSQVTPWALRSLVRTAKKACCSLVGTAALAGVSVTLIPESINRLTVPVPCLLESAKACTVMMTVNPGKVFWSGRDDGAVNVAVPLAYSLERVPSVTSVGQAIGLEGLGLGLAVVAAGVVV